MDVHTRFSSIVNDYGGNDAVVWVDDDGRVRSLSYRELDARGRELAGVLAADFRVRRGDRIGLVQGSDPDVIAAMLAISMLGAVYVPIDAELPAERRAFIDEDAGIGLRLASANPAEAGCLSLAGVRGKRLDSEGTVGEDECLYVMYTSGSTGRPKGVMVPHRAVLRLVVETDFMVLGPDTRFLQISPQSFDAATLEIWAPLLNGGACVLYPGRVADPSVLAQIVRRCRVNAVWLTAALFNQFIAKWPESLIGLDTLLFGGERASVAQVREAFRRFRNTRLINGYGPTENTTFTCCHTVTARDVAEAATDIPIGRPIRGTRIRIVNRDGGDVEIGEAGELLAGGAGLSLGYLNREELNASSFIADDDGATWYRTGDLVRRSADGLVHYLGRMDRQIKLQGHRIEPGEIEVAIMRSGEIANAHVVGMDTPAGENKLVAFIVGEHDPEGLRRQLASQLPTYMVPAAYVRVDELPLTGNGKVDHARLPNPFVDVVAVDVDASKSNGLVSAVERVWGELLPGVAPIRTTDNFFEIGGSSIDVLGVKERLDRLLDRDIPVVCLFQYPTIEKLAAYLESKPASASASGDARARAERRRARLSRRREPTGRAS